MRPCLVLAIAISVLALLLSGHCVRSDDVCNGAIPKLASQCQKFVLKPGPQIDPSADCCKVIKDTDVPCVCSHIPKGLENIISMEKVVHVANFCGKPMQHGSKCGSYTVPRT